MSGLFYAGAYAFYNPLSTLTPSEALEAWQGSFAACMRERGYEIPGPPATEWRAFSEREFARWFQNWNQLGTQNANRAPPMLRKCPIHLVGRGGLEPPTR
jgi:hypothetical protein